MKNVPKKGRHHGFLAKTSPSEKNKSVHANEESGEGFLFSIGLSRTRCDDLLSWKLSSPVDKELARKPQACFAARSGSPSSLFLAARILHCSVGKLMVPHCLPAKETVCNIRPFSHILWWVMLHWFYYPPCTVSENTWKRLAARKGNLQVTRVLAPLTVPSTNHIVRNSSVIHSGCPAHVLCYQWNVQLVQHAGTSRSWAETFQLLFVRS